MPGIVFQATSKAADAPNIEPGMADAQFEGVDTKFIEGGQYGDGERFVWSFLVVDDEGRPMYDQGDPLVIEGLTSLSTNTKSKTQPKTVRYLKALMTADEFARFEDGQGVDAEALIGRPCQIEIAVNDRGWPQVANVLPPRKRRVSAQ